MLTQACGAGVHDACPDLDASDPVCDCECHQRPSDDEADYLTDDRPWGEQQSQVDWLETRFDYPAEPGEGAF